jgi:hypothetical protein
MSERVAWALGSRSAAEPELRVDVAAFSRTSLAMFTMKPPP